MPYAVKALKDSLGNEIKSTYVANVVDDNGTLKFKDAEGNDVVSLVPSVESASNDSYGNLIADMVKTFMPASFILADSASSKSWPPTCTQ